MSFVRPIWPDGYAPSAEEWDALWLAIETALNISLQHRGAYNPATAYSANDVVYYTDSYYLALRASTGATPNASASDWRVLGGSGSGGGHRILNAAGTALVQRPDLQITGDDVTLTDNAPGTKTILSVLRKVAIRVGGIAKGIQPALNFIAGDNVNITATPNTDTGAVDLRIDSTTLATHIYASHEGPPSDSLYSEGDYVIDFTTVGAAGYGDIYQKGGGSYSKVGSVIGPRGLPGLAGTNGTTTRDGAGVPNDTVGADGDTWIDTSTWNRYKRVAGIYQLQGNIAGVFATIATQADAEAGTDNVKGMTPLRTKQAIQSNKGAYIMVQHQEANGVAGGTFTSGAWRTRVLNVEVADTGNNAALAGNQVTLQPGTYRFSARGIAYSVDSHQLRLQDTTGGVTLGLGESNYSTPTGNTIFPAGVSGRFTIATTSVIELQHRCVTTRATNGFGYPATIGSTEVYATLEFFKE